MSLSAALALDLGLLTLVMGIGAGAGRLLSPRSSRAEILAVSLPMGCGLLTFGTFLLSWIGVPIGLPMLGGIGFGLLILLGLARRSWRTTIPQASTGSAGGFGAEDSKAARWGTLSVVGVFAVLSISIALGRSHSLWDAPAIWASKGYGIAQEGTIFAAGRWGGHGLAYPLNIPLMIAFFQLVSGDVVPGSMLLSPLFMISIIWGVVEFWRRMAVQEWWVLAGVAMVATVPEIFRHSTYGYVNIPFTAYVVLGSLWAVRGLTRDDAGHLAVAGVLLSMAAWTRVEGIFYSLVVVVTMLGVGGAVRTKRWNALALVGPQVIVGGIWLVFYGRYGISGSQSGNAMAAALAGWGAGEFRLVDVRLILGYLRRSIVYLHTWGLLFPVALILLASQWRRLFQRPRPELRLVSLAALTTGLATAWIFYVGSYTSFDLWGWMQRAFPREFFPTAILIVVLTIAASAAPPRPSSPISNPPT